MAQIITSDSKAPLREVREVQFGILDPDEIVSFLRSACLLMQQPVVVQMEILIKAVIFKNLARV